MPVNLDLRHDTFEQLLEASDHVELDQELSFDRMVGSDGRSTAAIRDEGERFSQYRDTYPIHDGTIIAQQVTHEQPSVDIREDGDAYAYEATVYCYGETRIGGRDTGVTGRLQFRGSVQEDGLLYSLV